MSRFCRRLCRFSFFLFVGFVLCLILSVLPVGQTPVLAQASPVQRLVDAGIEQYEAGKFNEAIALFLQALSQSLPDEERAVVHNNLALAYRQVGQLGKAAQQWEQAIQIYQRQDNQVARRQLPKLLTEQAQAFNDLGQHRRAIKILQSVVEAAPHQDSRTQAAALGALGNAYWALGDYERALTAHQESLQIARQFNYSDYVTTSLTHLGNLYLSRQERYRYQADIAGRVEGDAIEQARLTQLAKQDLDSAQVAFEESLRESQALGSTAQIKALLNLNRLLEQTEAPDWTAIAKNREQALALVETLPDSRDKAYILINLAENFRRQGVGEDGNSAALLLEAALDVARTVEDRRAESFALGSLGELDQATGNLSRATDLIQQAQLAAEQVDAADSLYRWQWQTGRLLKAAGKAQAAIASYEQAIATLQSIRGNLLAANTDLQFDFRDSVEPVYRELIQLRLENKTPDPTQTLEKVIDTLDLLTLAELQNFFGDECVQVAQAEASREVSLAEAQTAIVYSVILHDYTEIILRLPNGQLISHSVSYSQAQMQQEIEQLRRLLEKRSTNEYLQPAQKLYDALIRPLEADIAAASPKTLVFIQDGVLRQVPMAALHDGETFLIEKYAIATTPSLALTTLAALQQRYSEALILGLTVERPPFAALTNVRDEVSRVQEILGGTKLLDRDFTLETLQEQLQEKSYPVVHIATHGKFGVDSTSTFLLAFDSRITLEEIDSVLRSSKVSPSSRRRQPVELLTLSACQTAVGDDRATLGIAGVAVRAGVRSALASLWNINDAATVPLIEEFYVQLQQPNVTKAEALQQAQQKAIAHLEYSHPAVWSPFTLIGNWQ